MMASHTTLPEKFVELQNAKVTRRNSNPKIQRVPEHLRNRENVKEHYLPKLVSIGPIHHGKENLKLGEKYKLVWAAQYIENAGLNSWNLYNKIVLKIDELKGLFAEDVLTATGESLNGFGSLDEKLSWILFLDGCSLLHIVADNVYLKDDQLGIVMMDVLLLENQIPLDVLYLLWNNEDASKNELVDIMKDFLKCHQWAKPAKATKLKDTWRSRLQYYQDTIKKFITSGFAVQKEEEHGAGNEFSPPISRPTHLLDLQRRMILDIKFCCEVQINY
ncbi:hypothetical protein L195_g041768 [Trifolium pratense]|uniref:DUF247 domain protein n=1 Tax=Trifolium pratense TaxID=57577 RepID=A0A2K3M4H9_TRIPR|nr:hypothetical protein L195_g041768 [Trifolium pratense]